MNKELGTMVRLTTGNVWVAPNTASNPMATRYVRVYGQNVTATTATVTGPNLFSNLTPTASITLSAGGRNVVFEGEVSSITCGGTAGVLLIVY